MPISSSSQRGFTIVELIVVIVVGTILLSLVFDTMGALYTDNTKSLGKTIQDTDTRGSLRAIETELTNVASFASALTVTAPLGAGGGTTWGYRGDDPTRRVFIAKVNATTEPPNVDTDNNRMPVFMPVSGDCNPTTATIAQVSYVYFLAVDQNSPPAPNTIYNLYRRTILPSTSTADYCNGKRPWQKQTCTPGTPTTIGPCEAIDALLLKNIKSFGVDYFSSSNSETPDVTASDSSDKSTTVDSAQSAVIRTKTTLKVGGQWNTVDADIRVSRW